MKTESIIESIHDRNHHQDARISAIEGRRYVRKPTYYKNTENGAEYYALAGSIAFPTGRVPGFAVVVAVLKEHKHEKAPRLEVLAELEEADLVALLTKCEQIRHRWGYPRTLDLWIGDAEMYLQAIADFNDRIETKAPDSREGLYITHPSDYEDHRRDVLYLQTVRQLLSPTAQGVKRLLIGDNPKLRAHLQSVEPNLKKVEEVPALAALAYACHTVLATTPWLEFTEPQRFEPTIKEDGFARVDVWPWQDDEPWNWDEDGFDDDDENPLDDGELTGTI